MLKVESILIDFQNRVIYLDPNAEPFLRALTSCKMTAAETLKLVKLIISIQERELKKSRS